MSSERFWRAESLEEDGCSVSEQGEGDCPMSPRRLAGQVQAPTASSASVLAESISGEQGTQLPPIQQPAVVEELS